MSSAVEAMRHLRFSRELVLLCVLILLAVTTDVVRRRLVGDGV